MTPPVLVVDDDPDSRAMLAALLTLRGFVVVTASDGAEGLVVARQHRPLLIFLDLMMPIMDGEQFRVEQLADPALASIPVILVTAVHRAADKASALGVAGCMQKPIDFDRLTTMVNGLINA